MQVIGLPSADTEGTGEEGNADTRHHGFGISSSYRIYTETGYRQDLGAKVQGGTIRWEGCRQIAATGPADGIDAQRDDLLPLSHTIWSYGAWVYTAKAPAGDFFLSRLAHATGGRVGGRDDCQQWPKLSRCGGANLSDWTVELRGVTFAAGGPDDVMGGLIIPDRDRARSAGVAAKLLRGNPDRVAGGSVTSEPR